MYETKQALWAAIAPLLPHASIEVDLDGQVVIYTDLHVVKGSDVLQNNATSYEVVVGNIGTIYSGYDEKKATEHFEAYRDDPPGRADGEVVLFANGDIEIQHAY
jgi:hypothetical protein